jgi:hypothetical protein
MIDTKRFHRDDFISLLTIFTLDDKTYALPKELGHLDQSTCPKHLPMRASPNNRRGTWMICAPLPRRLPPKVSSAASAWALTGRAPLFLNGDLHP